MTERFKTPEPSEGAVLEFNAAWNNPHLRQTDWLLRAFQADVPRIVRGEVERALDAIFGKDGLKDCSVQRYLAARFGEAAPEDAVERVLASLAKAYPYLVKHADHIDGEFSNALAEVRRMLAPTERREPDLQPGHCGMSNDGEDGHRCCKGWAHKGPCARPDTQTHPVYTDADRDRLARLERFVTALAKWAVAAHAVAEKVGTFGDAPHAEAAFREVAASAAAAREYLR